MKSAAKQQAELYERITKARENQPARGRGRQREEPVPPPELIAHLNKLPVIERLNKFRQ